MFNIGPLEMVVLALVGLIVIGPDKLPGFAKDAANLLRNLRDMATGARKQLRDELGPEFADIDFDKLRNLNPRTAVSRVVFGDDFDPDRLNPRKAVSRAVFGEGDDDWREEFKRGAREADPRASVREARSALYDDEPDQPVPMTKRAAPSMTKPVTQRVDPQAARPRPRPRPGTATATPYDADAT